MHKLTRLLAASTLTLSLAAPVAALAEEPAAAPAPAAATCSHKGGLVSRIKGFFLARDDGGSPRIQRWAVSAAGVGAMLGTVSTVATVGTAIMVIPACAQNVGACRTNLQNTAAAIPSAASPQNQRLPGFSAR